MARPGRNRSSVHRGPVVIAVHIQLERQFPGLRVEKGQVVLHFGNQFLEFRTAGMYHTVTVDPAVDR